MPAGASLYFDSAVEIMPSLYFGAGRGEYFLNASIWADGIELTSKLGLADVGIIWGPGPYSWSPPHSLNEIPHFTNSTGQSRMFAVAIRASRTFAGAGIRWSLGFDVPGGTTGVCNRAVSGSEFFGPNPAAGQQCPPCSGSTSNSVDTRSGNEHWTLPGVTIAGRGPGLDFQLGYNSLDAGYNGPLGRGWRSTYDMALSKNSDGTRTVFQETGSTVTFTKNGSGVWKAPKAWSSWSTP